MRGFILMTTNVKVASDIQELSPGRLIEMYELDLTTIGGTEIIYFTPVVEDDNTPITFNSVDYIPIQMETEGWEVTGEGTLPRPKITVSNVLLSFAGYVEDYDDMVGAKLTRKRTFKQYLDGESEADPDATFPYDIFVIERKALQDRRTIVFELSAYMDFEGIMIPKRQILRDTCLHNYRIYVSGAFDYTNATCPYTKESSTSPSYFDRSGDYTSTASNDRCGRRLSDCVLRFACNRLTGGETVTVADNAPAFPSTDDYWLETSLLPNTLYIYNGTAWFELAPEELPTRAFPSVAKLRV